MSTHDYRTRDEIIISVKSKAQADRDRAKPRKKGSVPPPKTDPRFLPRRKKPAGVIRFYDMGQKSDGSGGWVQNNFRYDPGLAVSPSPDPAHAPDSLVAVAPLNLAKIREFEASILTGVATADFPTKFRHILKSAGNSFPIQMQNNAGSFDFSSPEWIEDGLQVKQEDLSAPSDGSMFVRPWRFGTFGIEFLVRNFEVTNATKFTHTYDYAAPAISFNPDVNDKYFLMPYLAVSLGDSSSGSAEVILNHFFHIQTRNFSNPNYVPNDLFTNPNWAEALGYHTALTGTQTFTVTTTGLRLSLSAGGSFPAGTNGNVRFAPAGAGIGTNERQEQWAGQLIGIILQGSTPFYLWATVDI